MNCQHCNEPIAPRELMVMQMMSPLMVMHQACMLRNVVGSVGHQEHTCSCYGGPDEGDPAGMTKREAAKAAMEHFKQCRRVAADPYGWNR